MKHSVAADFAKSVSDTAAIGDRTALVRVCAGWSADRLVPMLKSSSSEIVRAAVIGLSVNGDMSQSPQLAALLTRVTNRALVELLEDALWSIWMRAGSKNANKMLAAAIHHVQHDALSEADLILRELVILEPSFAEPHHQRGIVQTLLDQYEDATEEFDTALRWNPYHFSAAANLGHVLVEREDFSRALVAYKRALQINPHLDAVGEALVSLKTVLQRAS
ncbi:MAG: hypothetical protein AB7N71_10270 [Phycisphaerae bacterium]